uniref:Putative mediator of rna polymerase ii transcription subunit 15 n=1 Tax=Culex tarsalis TaxID=7177 RepID=A0A1Q3EY77_CULTA
MSVPAARSQEDPYAFTETTPLPANTSLIRQQQPATVSTAVSTPTSVPIIQAGTSLLANNNNGGNPVAAARLNQHVVQQRTLLGTTAAKLAPIKVTLVQSPSGGILGKARLNGTTITSSPQGTVFRTVTVPQATTIVQRSMAPASSSSGNATPTVFTKPLQVQISPQQAAAVAAAGGKFTARRILASKSPNVAPVTTSVGGSTAHPPTGIQTVRIVKTSPANVLQTVGAGRTTAIAADGTRRFISHSGAASLLGSPVVVTTSVAAGTGTTASQQQQQQPSPQQLPTISPTKIRLIQPQPQGKIFLHTPNSSNSLAAATHISNPISIAALRNSLAKQNPSLLNKIVVQQQQQQHQQSPQQVQIAVSSAGSPSTSNGLPTVRMIPTSTAVTAINIRRAVSAAASATTATSAQPKRAMSLETGTTTVMVPTMAKPVTSSASPVVVKQVKVIPASSQAASPATSRPQTIQIPQTLLQQRAKTPTQSILKPQPPRPQPQPAVAKTPQKLVIAAPKATQQQLNQAQQQQQLHPHQVMVLASPKSLGGGAGGPQQQQVMVVTAPKGLGGHQQHQVVVLAPFKPGQLTAVNRQPQQLVATSLMKQIQQQQQLQQQQQILTSPVVKTIQKVQQPQQVLASPKQLQQPPQVVTSSPVAKPPQQQQPQQQQQQFQQVLATSVAKTFQQRQFITTSMAKPIQQQQVVVTSVAKPAQQPPQPQQVVATSIVKPVQQPQPQQVLINAAPKPPPQQQVTQPTQQPQQQFVAVPPPKPVPQPTPPPPTPASPQQQQPTTPQPVPAAIAVTPPPPTPTPPVSQPQDDFTIPSFIIPKQKEAKKVVPEKQVVPQQQQQLAKPPTSVPVAKPVPMPVPKPPPPPPSPVPVAVQVPQTPLVPSPPPPPLVPEPQLPSTSALSTPTPKPKVPKESGGGKSVVQKRAAKRSYSRSSHNETLERIDEPAIAPPAPKIHKWTPPAAVSVPVNREWHAPDSWIYDICPPGTRSYEELENAPLTMDCWFEEMYASSEFDAADLIRPRKVAAGRKGERVELPRDELGGELVELSSEERSERTKSMMRRRAVQYWNAQRLRDPEPARKRLKAVERVLNKLEKHRETMLSRNGGTDLPKCQRAGCERDALLATTHCREHIADNTEQRLFQRCTAKFSDNSQCQVPVFDIRHELILCREHAWKHDNHDKMSAEVRLLKKPAAPAAIAAPAVTPATIALKKKPPKMPLVKVVQPVHQAVSPAANKNSKASKKKKKLTPFQQQMALHQQQYKQQYAVKPTLPPPPYPAQQLVKQQQPSLYRQQSQPKYQQPAPVQIVPPTPPPPPQQINRNLQIPLNQQQQIMISGHHQQQQHMISRSEDLMLNYQGQSQLQQHQQYSHQQVQQILAAAAAGGGVSAVGGGGATQDLLNICENSSAYASSEDTGVGGLSESELMAAQDVIEEIPFEIGNLNNVLSQLPPDAFNELLFSEQEQNGPPFESTREEEEDLERALEAVGEHVKSLEDMTVESANLFGDFLDNVDDEMLDGPDMCAAAEQMLVVQSPGGPNDIRGLVHT